MMRRLLWMSLGAVGTVVAFHYLAKRAQAFSPESLARRANSVTETVRDFGHSVQTGMAEREEELRSVLFAENVQDPHPDDRFRR